MEVTCAKLAREAQFGMWGCVFRMNAGGFPRPHKQGCRGDWGTPRPRKDAGLKPRRYNSKDEGARRAESVVRMLVLRISQMARSIPAHSWAKILVPARVCHQE